MQWRNLTFVKKKYRKMFVAEHATLGRAVRFGDAGCIHALNVAYS